jgi:hypothetical protein
VTPALRLAFSLVLSLLVWLPTVPGALATSEDPARIAVRYLVALVISRLGVGLVFRIVNGYTVPAPEAALDPPETDVDDFDPVPFGRRRDDTEAEELLDEALEDVAETTALAQ